MTSEFVTNNDYDEIYELKIIKDISNGCSLLKVSTNTYLHCYHNTMCLLFMFGCMNFSSTHNINAQIYILIVDRVLRNPISYRFVSSAVNFS